MEKWLNGTAAASNLIVLDQLRSMDVNVTTLACQGVNAVSPTFGFSLLGKVYRRPLICCRVETKDRPTVFGQFSNEVFENHLVAQSSLEKRGADRGCADALQLFLDLLFEGKLPVEKAVRTIWPFYLAMFVALMLITFVPAISLTLPALISG